MCVCVLGPNPDTVADFWRMVWEQGSAIVVMLTNLEEKGRVRTPPLYPHHTLPLYVCVSVCVDQVSSVLARGQEWSVWQDQSPSPGVPGPRRLHPAVLLSPGEQLQGGEDRCSIPLHRVARSRSTGVPHLATPLCEENHGLQTRELGTHSCPLQVGGSIRIHNL